MTLEKYKRLCFVTVPLLIIAGILLAYKIINSPPYFSYSCTIDNCIPVNEDVLDNEFFKTRNDKLDNAILVNADGQEPWNSYQIIYGVNNLLSFVYLPDFKYGGNVIAVKQPITNEDIYEFSSLLDKKFYSAYFDLDIARVAEDTTIKSLKCYPPLMLYQSGIAKVNCDINETRAQVYIDPISKMSIDKIVKFSDDLAFDAKLNFFTITLAPTVLFFLLSGLFYLVGRIVRYVSTGK